VSGTCEICTTGYFGADGPSALSRNNAEQPIINYFTIFGSKKYIIRKVLLRQPRHMCGSATDVPPDADVYFWVTVNWAPPSWSIQNVGSIGQPANLRRWTVGLPAFRGHQPPRSPFANLCISLTSKASYPSGIIVVEERLLI
jgi:hypothetical protein